MPFYRKTVVHRRRSLSSSHFHIRTVSTNRLVYVRHHHLVVFLFFHLIFVLFGCVCVSVCWWLLLSALYGKRRPTAALVLCNMPARHSFPCVVYAVRHSLSIYSLHSFVIYMKESDRSRTRPVSSFSLLLDL